MNWRLTPFTGRELARLGDNPFAKIQRELNRALDDVWSGLPFTDGGAVTTAIRIDLKEDDKAYHVTADLPGMTEKDVEVSFQDGILTIRGEKKIERDEKQDTWHIVERSSGSFVRQFNLPANIDNAKIAAKFDKGVLAVMLPKKPEQQAKKIEITTS
jgi:HSP20 family protein